MLNVMKMYVCLFHNLYLYCQEQNETGLANETDIQIDDVADRLATCTWTLGALMKLDTEADGFVDEAE